MTVRIPEPQILRRHISAVVLDQLGQVVSMAGAYQATLSTGRVPSPEQSGQHDVSSASVTGTADQKLQSTQRHFTMPGIGTHGSALVTRAAASCPRAHIGYLPFGPRG
jgi:hypothetical protein